MNRDRALRAALRAALTAIGALGVTVLAGSVLLALHLDATVPAALARVLAPAAFLGVLAVTVLSRIGGDVPPRRA